MWKQSVIALLITAYLSIAGCATIHSNKGVFHRVGKGETLWRIAHAYGVDLQDLAEANNIKDPTQIKKGQRLFIPGIKKKTRKVDKSLPEPPLKSRKVTVEKGRFAWPVKGAVISSYGMRNDVMHHGIEIAAPRNKPVRGEGSGATGYFVNGM